MRHFSKHEEIVVVAFVFLLLVYAYANAASTTMTWFVATSKSMTLTYGSPCSSTAFFFNETNAQFDSDTDGNGSRVVPQATRVGMGDTNCQSAGQAPITVNNTGTASFNVDGNFASGFLGADINIVLKVWLGSNGCGTNGLGGWEKDCTFTFPNTTSGPTTSTCRQFNSTHSTDGARIITSLAPFNSQELCFSGDFNGFVSGGDHNATFQLGTDYS